MFPDQARLIARVVPNTEYDYEDPWDLNPAKQCGDRGAPPAVGDRGDAPARGVGSGDPWVRRDGDGVLALAHPQPPP
eukprot:1587553-Pyramimonas_sp.AAC.1